MKGSRNSAEWFKELLRIALFVLMPLYATAQATDTAACKADSADVKTIHGIVNALYDVISGEAGRAIGTG